MLCIAFSQYVFLPKVGRFESKIPRRTVLLVFVYFVAHSFFPLQGRVAGILAGTLSRDLWFSFLAALYHKGNLASTNSYSLHGSSLAVQSIYFAVMYANYSAMLLIGLRISMRHARTSSRSSQSHGAKNTLDAVVASVFLASILFLIMYFLAAAIIGPFQRVCSCCSPFRDCSSAV